MKKIIILLFFIVVKSFSQNYKVIYSKSSNGKTIENQDNIWVLTNSNQTLISSEKMMNEKADFPFEQNIVERNSNDYFQIATLSKSKSIQTKDSLSLAKQNFEFLNETKKILGYNCKKAKTIINSNTIELWYTEDLKVKGAPTILGQNLGLVLEMNRNGNYAITVTKIEKIKSFPVINFDKSKNLDLLSYRDLLWKSRFTTVEIFKEQIINFSDASKSNDSVFRFANGTIAVRKIKFPEIKVGSQIFADLTEQSNGDAYDRTGSFFIIPTNKQNSFLEGLENGKSLLPIYTNGNGKEYQGVVATENYNPVVELMQFFTPFGVKQYNTIQLKDKTWQENVFYRQDVSDLRSLLNNQEVYVGVFIGNYDKGGHKVSANFTIHQEEDSNQKEKQIVPLFCTNNIMEMAGQEYGTMFNSEKGLVVNFNLDKALKNCKLRYISTGHGGWENGDEFVPKKNSIYLDEKETFSFTPWRQDCGSYRLSNPASGNFSNGLSSSDYSRSNWCPGTVTNPIYIDLGDLDAGNHSIQIKIPQGLPEGNSFSAWNVSGVLIGE
ncbi:GLPGLI family protein [Flavobacterium capsici]|uniref:GLPGLI family protein n=1 Tax=Flavobacterium capsici TaxID=3075618 RepID=A0AA96J2F7_9FLAO|nr:MULTISPECIES: GLPGLI family protein [unclassified Flavobacterium]WNM19065.1 GLPGLI family protein [Flavobacterium sp. PMR2A8]WNM20454.1 GLPGLI family protein [Flavobacterium sp. PMTSA4]